VDAFRIQFGVKVLEAQKVPVRGEVRLDAGEEIAIRFGGLAQIGRAALRQRQVEATAVTPSMSPRSRRAW
jgi:hypothetical protein